MASTVLVDCNESSPGVARRLGLQLQPHVLDAVEVATAGGDVRSVLAQPAESVAAAKLPFDVVAGLPAPSEWQRWSPASADVLLAACRGGWRLHGGDDVTDRRGLASVGGSLRGEPPPA